MEKVTVKRTGRPSLRFKGELLADCDSEYMSGTNVPAGSRFVPIASLMAAW